MKINNIIGDEGALKISELLMTNTAITELVLTNSNIYEKGGIEIGKSLTFNKSLTKLYLGGVAISIMKS